MKKALKISGIIFIFMIAFALIFNGKIATFLIENQAKVSISADEIDKNKDEKPYIDRDNIDTLTPADVIKGRLADNKALYIGYLAVPSIGLKLPIINELSNYSISIGAAVYYDNMKMGKGNYVLASHFWYDSETALFSPLYYNVSQGAKKQKMYLTDLKNLYTYEVSTYKVVNTTETSYIQQDTSENLLTLFTCNYTADAGRIVMQGKLVSTQPLNEIDETTLNEIK